MNMKLKLAAALTIAAATVSMNEGTCSTECLMMRLADPYCDACAIASHFEMRYSQCEILHLGTQLRYEEAGQWLRVIYGVNEEEKVKQQFDKGQTVDALDKKVIALFASIGVGKREGITPEYLTQTARSVIEYAQEHSVPLTRLLDDRMTIACSQEWTAYWQKQEQLGQQVAGLTALMAKDRVTITEVGVAGMAALTELNPDDPMAALGELILAIYRPQHS
ncbi:MAG: hypothetical protein LBJ69_03590 [Holosporales bacterium]|jgi:hypothetical protein|nr:hypothetical protein [Holosporales bacterium]